METPSPYAGTDDWVEIELNYEAFAYVPVRYEPDLKKHPSLKPEVGTVLFEEVRINDESECIKVKVPPSAVKSPEALEQYLHNKAAEDSAEFVHYKNCNIWDAKEEKYLFDIRYYTPSKSPNYAYYTNNN